MVRRKGILDVTNELKNLMDTFGEMLIRFGASEALQNANKSLRTLMNLADFIADSFERQSIDWERFLGLTGLKNSLDFALATWRTYIEQIRAYASGKTTSQGLVDAQIAQAEAHFRASGKLPKIGLGDVRGAVGAGEKLPGSALGMLGISSPRSAH